MQKLSRTRRTRPSHEKHRQIPDEIAGFSNAFADVLTMFCGLEGNRIAGFSNTMIGRLIWEMGLEEDEITWYSNFEFRCRQPLEDLEEDEITWYQTCWIVDAPQNGLKEDKITWYSNTIIETSTIIRGLEEDKITWYSNSKKCSECCTVGLADVKLHGAQTGFLRCADEFPAWKGELHGTQTHATL